MYPRIKVEVDIIGLAARWLAYSKLGGVLIESCYGFYEETCSFN